jgi:photosystem II stability/assembly factor-like uncharacterized protein
MEILVQSLGLTGETVNPFPFPSFSGTFCSRESVFCMNDLRICLNFPTRYGFFALLSLLILFTAAVPRLAAQAFWSAIGPAGGDARALAAVPGQPDHLYLGSTNSWLYESVDGGASWRQLAKLDPSDDLILDHIVVDRANPATVYVAAWELDHPGGGLWVSRDGGRNWSEIAGLHGQSIRSFAQAPSNPQMLFAGTLDGVFRSTDAGVSWAQISPPGSNDIHEVESLAIAPENPEVIYAGTWHLPWKTTDGGNRWHSIKQGVIEDSDVFSIIVDPARPETVFASACSGVYKSLNGGELFHRVQGIPSTARRTRVLMQDPAHREVIYAGTTEGLYKTVDGGKSFQRMTGPEVIVNDVFIDPRDSYHVLLATDRGGVLLSNDAGASFAPANEGFSARKVEALLVDNGNSASGVPASGNVASGNPARLFAGVVNDKSYGGVFVSTDGGEYWRQIDAAAGGGLGGRDVFVLAESPESTILAGTNNGIFALNEPDKTDKGAGMDNNGSDGEPDGSWSPRNTIQNTLAKTAGETHDGERVNVAKHVAAKHVAAKQVAEKQVKEKPRKMDGRVYALDLSGDVWLASTVGGLFTSRDHGASWQGGPVLGAGDYLSVAAHGPLLAAVRQEGVVLSTDGGHSWTPIVIPLVLTRIHCVAFSADGALWLGAREGVYFTRDLGRTWLWATRFPLGEIDSLSYDAHLDRILISSRSSDQIYALDPKSLGWTWVQTGYRINLARAVDGRLLAASLYDGVVVQPSAATPQAGQK